MPQEKSVNTFENGMVKVDNPTKQPKNSYPFALNATINDIILDRTSRTNEKSIDLYYVPNSDTSVLLGYIWLGNEEYVLFMKHIEGDDIFNKIIYINPPKNITRVLYDNLLLNFQDNYEIKGTYRINYKNQRIIYWIDGLNDDRILNIDIDNSTLDIDLLSIGDSAIKPILRAIVLDTGGSITSGQYFLAMNYNLGDSFSTSIYSITNPISIANEKYFNTDPVESSNTEQYGATDGDVIPIPTSKALNIELTNLDDRFTSYNLYIIKINADSTFSFKKISDIDINTELYLYTGNEGEIDDTIDINTVITDNIKYYASEAITQKENRLIRGNTKLKQSAIDYQQIANNIIVKYRINEELVYNKDMFNNPIESPNNPVAFETKDTVYKEHSITPSYLANTANIDIDNKSFERDSVYSLGIGLEFIDGSESEVFHIPGRAINTLSDITGVGEYGRTYVPNWDTMLIDNNDLYWQKRNSASTSGDLAYWRSSLTYSDDYGYPIDGEKLNGRSYIRHHRMPSDILEPIYRTEIIGDPNAGNATTNYKIYKRNLGLTFSNIVIPEKYKGIVSKIKIYYTPRNEQNKNIISKGLLFGLNEEDGEKNQSQQPEGGLDTSKTIYEFISPDINFKFKEKSLIGSRIKVNSINKGYIQYVGAAATRGNLGGIHFIRYYNNQLADTTAGARQQAIIVPTVPFIIPAIPNQEIYSRDINNALYIDSNFKGSSGGFNIDFTGSQESSIIELKTPIKLIPEGIITTLSTYYPDLKYPAGSNISRVIYEALETTNGETSDQKYWQNKVFYETVLYISILNSNTSLYGKIEDLQYISSTTTLYNNVDTIISVDSNNGDTFIDMHHLKKTWVRPVNPGTDPQPYALNLEAPLGEDVETFNDIYEFASNNYISFMCETDINIRMRREDLTLTNYEGKYFPKSMYANHSIRDYAIGIATDGYNHIDDAYNKQFIKYYFANRIKLDEFTEANNDIRYSTRIIYSGKQELEDKTDNYRISRANDYRDLPLNRGPITIFFTKQDKLYTITRDSLYDVFASNQTIKSENADNIVVGTGEFLSIEPIELISIDGGYGGSSSKFSLVESPFGYLFVDKIKNKCFLFNDQLKDINILGLNEDFTISLYKQFPELVAENGFDNPVVDIGIIAIYDPELQRIIVTKKDYKALPAVIENYVGEYDPDATYEIGDIVLRDGTLMVITGVEEIEIISESNFSTWIIDNNNQYSGDILIIDPPTAGEIVDTNSSSVTYRLDEETDDSFTINQSGSLCAEEIVNITRNVYLTKWIGSGFTCEQEGGLNTGIVEVSTLLRVSDDEFELPLDANGNPTSVTGLPQDTKPNDFGDPNYIAPYEDLETCPNTYKFHSLVIGGNPVRSVRGDDGMVYPSAAPFQWYGSMANSTIIENTIPGININGWLSDNNTVLTATLGGDYRIKVNGLGSVTFYTDNGQGFWAFIDFYIQVNSIAYPLSPFNPVPEGFTFQYQYRATSPGGSMSHKEASVGYILTLDQTFSLNPGDKILFFAAPRFSAVTGKLGNVRINNTSLELDITLS